MSAEGFRVQADDVRGLFVPEYLHTGAFEWSNEHSSNGLDSWWLVHDGVVQPL